MLSRPTKRIIVLIAIFVAVAALVLVGFRYGKPLWNLFRNPERIQKLIAGWGIWAPLGMILVQIVQVVVAPLPGNVVAIVSGYVFGWSKGLLLCLAGVVLGALIAFLLARLVGRRLLRLFVAEATMDKFDSFVVRKGPFYLLLLLLAPNPIGDWIYYLAGLTAIPLPLFAVLVLVGRIPSNLIETFIGVQMFRLGSQAYHLVWWHWTLVLAVVVVVVALYLWKRTRIERFFARLAGFPIDD
jgi:uncharacterized membrane protein YdjX (TVP38/TMEM64 family)